jgi:hypothetical protein
MKKQLFFLLTLLAFALLLAAPTGSVLANGATRTPFTGQESVLDSYGGYPTTLPNGKTIIRDFVLVCEFQSSDLRVNGLVLATFNNRPGSDSHNPWDGTFQLQPYGITDGYWEGTVNVVFSPTGARSVFTARGYGSLEGQILQGTNVNGQLSGQIIQTP